MFDRIISRIVCPNDGVNIEMVSPFDGSDEFCMAWRDCSTCFGAACFDDDESLVWFSCCLVCLLGADVRVVKMLCFDSDSA